MAFHGNDRFSLSRVGIWTSALEATPVAHAQEAAAELEQLGYGAIWMPEIAGRHPFVQLTLLLSATERLVAATGIASIWARDAVTASCGIKAMTEAFPERVLLGLGVSHPDLVEGLRGHRYDKPLSAMRAYLEAMDAAPYTAQAPTTPTRRVLAALRPKMLALAAERADGAHTYFVTPQHTARAREALGTGPLLCPEQAVLVETDPEVARAVGREYMKLYLTQSSYLNNLRDLGFSESDLVDGGSDKLVDAVVAWGDVDVIADRVREHLDAGADHVAVQALPTATARIPTEQWRELAPALTTIT